MDDSLTFTPLTESVSSQIEGWGNEPGSLANHLNDYLHSRGSGWAALRNGEPVAVAFVTLDDAMSGYLDVLVKPSERRKGFGTRLARFVVDQPEIRTVPQLRASAQQGNTAAQKILARLGFHRNGFASDGSIEFIR